MVITPKASTSLFVIFVIRLPVTIGFSQPFQAKVLGYKQPIGKARKVPKNCDEGIKLNGSVKTESLPCSLKVRETVQTMVERSGSSLARKDGGC